MALSKLSAYAGWLVVALPLCASPITLNYTQYFDFPGIAGHPSATWTAVFELATHPTNPFAGITPTLNADFLADGFSFFDTKPTIGLWDGDKIGFASSVFIALGAGRYVEAPINPFGHCNQPCTDIAGMTDFAFAVPSGLGVQALTRDVFSGAPAPATIPEPNIFALMLLGSMTLLVRRCFPRPHERRIHRGVLP